VIYSGHDASLLSVLRTMDAEIGSDIGWWPEYSSALALELLGDENGNFFVDARLNGEVLATGRLQAVCALRIASVIWCRTISEATLIRSFFPATAMQASQTANARSGQQRIDVLYLSEVKPAAPRPEALACSASERA
jgi:hypothetical protein